VNHLTIPVNLAGRWTDAPSSNAKNRRRFHALGDFTKANEFRPGFLCRKAVFQNYSGPFRRISGLCDHYWVCLRC
jgi:hypothetical protein